MVFGTSTFTKIGMHFQMPYASISVDVEGQDVLKVFEVVRYLLTIDILGAWKEMCYLSENNKPL